MFCEVYKIDNEEKFLRKVHILLAGTIYAEWSNVDCGSSCAKNATKQCLHNCQEKCRRPGYALSVSQVDK